MLFDKCFEILIGHEGGYQALPSDPGNWANGRLVGTKYGISARAYPAEDIKNLTLARAKQIYWRDYWDAAGCERITDPGLALAMFDTAVNSGVGCARRLYRPGMTVDQFLDARLAYLKSLSTWASFGRGWAARIRRLREQCASMR